MVRRSLYEDVGGIPDLSFGEDASFNGRVQKKIGRLAACPDDPAFIYRWASGRPHTSWKKENTYQFMLDKALALVAKGDEPQGDIVLSPQWRTDWVQQSSNTPKPLRLTVAMATYDDYDGVYFTITAMRMYHKLPPGTEFLILDNNPDSPHGKALAHFAKQIPNTRLIQVRDRSSSFVKYDALSQAQGDVILGIDCHVLLQPGFIEAMMTYWQANPDSKNMMSGPLIYNDLKATSVKMEPRWRGHDFGCWGDDPAGMKAGLPFEIPMQGMGCYSLLKKNAPKINPLFRGFGAEEWYMAEKIHQQGGKVICHPAMGWNHRFDWPKRTFPIRVDDKLWNYYIGWLELYGSIDHPRIVEMTEHWKTEVPEDVLLSVIAKAELAHNAATGKIQAIPPAPKKNRNPFLPKHLR